MNRRRRIQISILAGLLFLGAGAASFMHQFRERASDRGENIFLLHGMGRTRASLFFLSRALEERGYRVFNFPYEERTVPLRQIALDLKAFISKEGDGRPYHLVGHSLGNIVIREGFRQPYPPGLQRIVMLAPPNRPAELAGKLADNLIYRWVTGDSGQRLSDDEFYRTLPVPSVPFGVIAGTMGQSLTFDKPNDGVVLVENTKLEGMTAWTSVPQPHTFIMNGDDTRAHLLHFLEEGTF